MSTINISTINRLQFRYHEEIFENREDAKLYIEKNIREAQEGLASIDPSYGYSLLAEPTVLLYKTEDYVDEKDAHLMLVIGSYTNSGNTWHDNNRFCIIDIDKTEAEIEGLEEELEKAIKSLSIIALSSDTIDFHAEKTADGTFVSGDVKTAETHIYDDVVKDNNLMIVPRGDEAGPEGLFIYVDLTYDEPNETFTFVVSNADGTLKKEVVKLPNNYLVSGRYNKEDESIYLHMKDGEDVVVNCEELIAEWRVEEEASNTPIVLKRERIGYGDESDEHYHVEPWQDVLRGDVRIADDRPANILKKTTDGRYLYVDGIASNIMYFSGGTRTTVKDALDELSKIKISQDDDNIIVNRADGFFAATKLDYITNENTLVFTTTNVSGEYTTKRIPLNTVDVIESITYDPVREVLVIKYKNDKGETQTVEVPISIMIDEWDVLNNAHSVKLVKQRNVGGKDILSADVNISTIENNILEKRSEHDYHTLYVKGTSDNIKHNDTTVKAAIDALESEDEAINQKLGDEIARATEAEEVLTNKIGTGFTTDPHDNVTYKFEQLTDKVNSEADKLQGEIDRSEAKDTEHDGRLDAIDEEIGDGFGSRNTVRDEIENLQSEVDAVSADSSSRLSNVINEDESIDVETRDDAAGKPTVKVVKVNLSTEVEDDRKNIIKLNSDGLFANVDLSYIEEANKLIFHTSNGEPDKEIQLESMSSIVDIKYDPNKEAIIITYMTNGHEIKTVEIPVGDLIREWKPSENTDGAIKLTLTEVPSGTTGKDILYGEVLISDHADNILINDGGKLYVSNSDIVANAAAIEALDGRMDTAETDIDTLENNLREEASARTLADEALGARIDQEIEDRIADVNAEETRATSAETALFNKIDADVLTEKNRATTAEGNLQEAINDEINNRNAAILVETNRATSAETALQEALNREIHNREDDVNLEQSRAEAAETALTNKINTDIEAERNRAISAETALQTAIETETQRATHAESELNTTLTTKISETATILSAYTQTSVNDEKVRAMNAEGVLNQAIQDETSRANAADQLLQDAIGDEVERSTAKDNEHDTKIVQNHNDIVAEVTRAKANEDVISGNVISEETRAKAAEEAIKSTLSAETADRISGDTTLQHLIEDEETRAKTAESGLSNAISAEAVLARGNETRLEGWITDERVRAQAKENELNTAITNETIRANSADTELYQSIADEKVDRTNADAALSVAISGETSRALAAENTLRETLATETNNRTNAETNLSNAITAETQARQSADDTLQEAIEAATHTYSATTTARLVKSADNVVTADVIIPTDNNIIINDEGVKAFVRLDYDAATNKLILEKTSPSGRTHDVVTLNAGSIINSITYDTATKELVIRYTSTSDPEHTENETRVSVADLFNPMIENNPSSGSAVVLHISKGTGKLGEDEISGKVLLTNLEDNAIQIVNNGLYVPAADMQEALEIAKCAKNELGVFEKVVIGSKIDEECGSGYTYQPNNLANYINTATSFNNADLILDQNIKRVENKVDEASGKTDCIDSKANKIYELLYGSGSTIQGCGESAKYTPDLGSCIISGATSFMEADRLLGDQMCEILEMWQSGMTCTSVSDWVDDGANKRLEVDVRLSHGSRTVQSDDDIVITDFTGDYIDPTRTEFTDTNALRIVCLQEGESGSTPAVESKQNGLYLSNVWDCGLYYDEENDADAIAAANAAGYITGPYRTDSGSTASNYNYMNNVRQKRG